MATIPRKKQQKLSGAMHTQVLLTNPAIAILPSWNFCHMPSYMCNQSSHATVMQYQCIPSQITVLVFVQYVDSKDAVLTTISMMGKFRSNAWNTSISISTDSKSIGCSCGLNSPNCGFVFAFLHFLQNTMCSSFHRLPHPFQERTYTYIQKYTCT